MREAGISTTSPWVRLLGTFSCGSVESFRLPPAGERLVAFVALQRHPVARKRVAGVLWPEVSETRALALLRSTLWRVHRRAAGVVEVRDDRLGVAPGVVVDADVFSEQSRRLIADEPVDGDGLALTSFGSELLADWYDDWVLFERERFRQLALHGLEALSRRHLGARRFAAAIEAGGMAVALEPLRESAQACLIEAHLAEGNVSEALAQYRAYVRLLADELGIAPTDQLTGRVAAELRRRGAGVEFRRQAARIPGRSWQLSSEGGSRGASQHG